MKFQIPDRLYKLIGLVLVSASLARAQGIITTVAGSSPNGGFSGDGGPATSAGLFLPRGVAVDATGNVYIADTNNNRIRKVTPGGIITTVAGNGQFNFSGDGGPATSATIVQPYAIVLDRAGNLFIADYGNNRIRKVTPGGTISTVAGNGTFGSSGDGGPAISANLNRPYSVAVDIAGNLYIADNQSNRIRKVTSGGTISTVAGNGGTGFSGDGGPATSAQMNAPYGVAVDATGNLYIADNQNNRIRKVTSGGTISTVAGSGSFGFSGDGGPATSARLSNPRGLLVDAAGNLYIGDSFNHCIRKVTPGGIISTAAGLCGSPGFSGDNGPATSAKLIYPDGVALDAAGNLYIADSTNQRVRRVTIAAPPPSAPSVIPKSLKFSGLIGSSSVRQALQISNSGTLNWTADVTLQNGIGWLVVSPPSGSASANLPSTLNVDVNFGALSAVGVYQALISVRDLASNLSVSVPVTATVTAEGPRLLLSQGTLVFTAAQAGSVPRPQTLRILNAGQENLSWSIPANALASTPWLNVSAFSGVAAPGQPSSTTWTVNPAGLAAGVFQALIPVSVSGALASQQLVSITLHVVPGSTPSSGQISPNGMGFVATQGAAAPSVQTMVVSNTGSGILTFQLQPSTTSGGNWLAVSTTSGSTASGPATTQVSANPAGLSAGLYRGKITATFSSGGPQEVDVMLVVAPSAVALQRSLPGGFVCAGQSMDLIATTIGNGTRSPVSFPSALLALLVDSCGASVPNATVVAAVEGVIVTLGPLGDGFYSGTWVPTREAAAMAVSFTALHPSYSTVQRSFTVSTTAAAGGVSLPVLTPDGAVEGAGFTPLRPLAPGGIISIFGSRLSSGESSAGAVPLPREMGGVNVRMGGESAPLYYVGPGQINAQVPFSLRPGDSVPVVVTTDGRLTAPQSYLIAPGQPGVFVGGAYAAVLDGQSRAVTAENHARIGDTLQIYATGLGLTDPAAETGAAAPPFSTLLSPVTVTIGGVDVPVVYQGLAPGFVGLYQVNVVLPASVAPGNAALVLRQNGIASNPNLPATIPVRAP